MHTARGCLMRISISDGFAHQVVLDGDVATQISPAVEVLLHRTSRLKLSSMK